jgi:hypothetical protein
MAWTTISNALVAVGAKPFATTVQALRDNPVAIAEFATGAPVDQAAWHPYDMANVGDGAIGKFYDFAIDGAVTAVETPAFVAGYEYAVRVLSLSATAVLGLTIEMYRQTDAAYTTVLTYTGNVSSGANGSGGWLFPFAGVSSRRHAIEVFEPWAENGSTINLAIDGASTFEVADTTQQIIGKARFSWGSNSDAGTMRLYRRRIVM